MQLNALRSVEAAGDGSSVPEPQAQAPPPSLHIARKAERFFPYAPRELADSGLPDSLVEQLILKLLYFRGEKMGSELSRSLGLPFACISDLLENFKGQHLVQVKRSLGYGPVSEVVSLTERGRSVARDYLETNQYVGPAPVPMAQYSAAVEAQRKPPGWLSPDRLAKAYSHLVVNEDVLDQIGPAVTSGKSLLLYGQPGNGKTQLAEGLAKIESSAIYIPYCLEFQGNLIQLFDPNYHQIVEAPERKDESILSDADGRWARCRRPFLASGGELALSMLDLSYNPVSKVYDAPFQLKANNGIYLIDDFGRQKATSTEILNRWIIPMEQRIDYLSFLSGGKMVVPFETFLIFSTNLSPEKLGDEAFLRRIQYKVLMRSPVPEEFKEIFRKYCAAQNLRPSEALIDRFVAKHYLATGKRFRRCHPRDVVSQALDYLRFKRQPCELSEEALDKAFASCFLSTDNLTDT